MDDGEADTDASGDLAQGLPFGSAGQDRAAFVVVDDGGAPALSPSAGSGLQAVAGLAGDVAAPVLGQGESQVEDEAALGVLAGAAARFMNPPQWSPDQPESRTLS
ncbi:hypothetical protein [Nocardia brasiliensis]|uniref:hypothetical protein n=1 Tax=Nocardia brasiliensis TaxID=37326 RepID=UPI0004A6BF3A|nr:hypothetical protein [Nocardia brasiliensis]